jgi:hypothetical protein
MTSTGPAIVILALTLSARPADAADDATVLPSIDQSATLGPFPIVWNNLTWGDAKVSRHPTVVAARNARILSRLPSRVSTP